MVGGLSNATPTQFGVAVGLALLLLATGAWGVSDLDGDSRPAYVELQDGTDPVRSDTDGDTLRDDWELAQGLSPTSPDTDGDGLTDDRELALRIDPLTSDTDGDGLEDLAEVEAGTNPADSDTDEDELSDATEATRGTDPLAWDTDGDGVDDGREAVLGGDPLTVDTDHDGLDDLEEAREGDVDCNGNGVHAMAESDDDSDRMPDADEEPAHRCNPDVDGDGVLDGEEGNRACIPLPDCDLDGLLDGEELSLSFDRLDPDTFDTGLRDGVVRVFREAGQPPSSDADRDGIPDAWEETQGLIDWQGLAP
ncbi:MAG: hypothetical protein R3185_07405, partial [Candidatus Thermoplasmatota archaeon]|nr:hypothetical protein [Candidatus Thermoplasmatota archaeon]